MEQRFTLIPPVEGGDQWWNFNDNKAPVDSPYCIQIYAQTEYAEDLARGLLSILNATR